MILRKLTCKNNNEKQYPTTPPPLMEDKSITLQLSSTGLH